jgi:hypothetical protein
MSDARDAGTSESIPSKVHGIVESISVVFCSTYAMAAHAGTSQSFGASGGAKELKGAEPPTFTLLAANPARDRVYLGCVSPLRREPPPASAICAGARLGRRSLRVLSPKITTSAPSCGHLCTSIATRVAGRTSAKHPTDWRSERCLASCRPERAEAGRERLGAAIGGTLGARVGDACSGMARRMVRPPETSAGAEFSRRLG